jgi:hypothetical protein
MPPPDPCTRRTFPASACVGCTSWRFGPPSRSETCARCTIPASVQVAASGAHRRCACRARNRQAGRPDARDRGEDVHRAHTLRVSRSRGLGRPRAPWRVAVRPRSATSGRRRCGQGVTEATGRVSPRCSRPERAPTIMGLGARRVRTSPARGSAGIPAPGGRAGRRPDRRAARLDGSPRGAIRVPVPGLGREDGRGRRPAAQSRSGPPSRDRTAAAMARPPAGAAGAVARGASSASHSASHTAPARVDHPSRGRPPDEAEGLRGDDEGPGDAGALGRRAPVGGGRRRGNMRLARLRGDVRPVGQMVLDVVRSCQR